MNVYVIRSKINSPGEMGRDAFLAELEEAAGFALHSVPLDLFAKDPFGLLYVATGGSEGAFLEMYDRVKDRPLLILTSGASNSLAAAMEILSFLRQNGGAGEILHGSIRSIASRLKALAKAGHAREALSGTRLGLVGEPSDWLISSRVDPAALHAKLSMEVVKISMEELLSEIGKGGYGENQWTKRLMEAGYDREAVESALQVYGAFRRLVDKYRLKGISVRCFDLLSAVKTTGCLGLAILNAEGVYGGCEGDMPSLVSMCILGEISGKPVFMCNPSRMDPESGTMVFAHCTLPVHMPTAFRLDTHFESGIGVAVAGDVPTGTCTVFKASGDLSRHFAAAGSIVENLREPTLCRTQIRVRLPDCAYFTSQPIGNHHLVCNGDETEAIEAFFTMLA